RSYRGVWASIGAFRRRGSPAMQRLATCLLAALALAACQGADAPADSASRTADGASAGDAAFEPGITEADFARHVGILASDAFEGRAPGTPGGEKTVEYIRAQMERIGLQPGNNGEWFQDVPMVETTA